MTMLRKALLIIFAIILINVLSSTCLMAGSLVAYWSFDEADVDVLTDQSGTGNDGEINGEPEWVDGKFGKAIKKSMENCFH